MKFFQTAVLLAVGAGSSWAAADPQLLGLLMPEAKMLAGVQLGQAKASPFGQFVLSQVAPNATEFDKLKAATGFDPRTDLTEVVAGTAGPDGKGLIAGHGTFQPARLTNLALTAGATVESYRGINIITVDPKSATAAFLDGTTVVMGTADLVKASVDRWISATQTSGSLVSKAKEVSATSQAWAVATGLSELAKMPTGTVPPEAQMVQNVLSKISQISGGLNFAETITMHGQAITNTSQDAQSLADVFQFLMSVAPKTPLPVLPQVTASGSTVNFTLTLTEQQVEQLLKPPAPVARVAAVRRARK